MVTSGNQGSQKYAAREEIGAVREKEMLAAAKYYDAPVRFLRFNDQRLFDTEETRTAVLDAMRWADPDVIFTNNPGDPSVDHRIVGQMVADNMLSLPGKLVPASEKPCAKTPTLFFCEKGMGIEFDPEVYVDISAEFDEKMKAYVCHESQREWMKEFGLEDMWTVPRTLGMFWGAQIGVKYAEAFRAFRIHGYMPNLKLLPY
jgi:LmbE family N-acetylglucosaminyl deacetylase